MIGRSAVKSRQGASGPFSLREKVRMRADVSNDLRSTDALPIPALTQPLPEGEV